MPKDSYCKVRIQPQITRHKPTDSQRKYSKGLSGYYLSRRHPVEGQPVPGWRSSRGLVAGSIDKTASALAYRCVVQSALRQAMQRWSLQRRQSASGAVTNLEGPQTESRATQEKTRSSL